MFTRTDPTAGNSITEQHAIQCARAYLSVGNFSRAALIAQLSSRAGEGFTVAEAVYAVDHINADYQKHAVECARGYASLGSVLSRASLIGQLSSMAGDQFTVAQATYAAAQVEL